jgi:hypothetical protein
MYLNIGNTKFLGKAVHLSFSVNVFFIDNMKVMQPGFGSFLKQQMKK